MRPTTTDDEVKTAMEIVLRTARETGRRPTITAVERLLDVRHATFYRNFPHLIDWFKAQVGAQRQATQADEPEEDEEKPSQRVIADLRREVTQLRRTVATYAEALRQLTLDYEDVRGQVQQHAQVTDLASRRSQR